jgi:hypothetical protein
MHHRALFKFGDAPFGTHLVFYFNLAAEMQVWLGKFNDDRAKRITQTKKDNAAQESAAVKGPTGDTEWAKVNSMIDFTFKPPQERETERERFKAILFAAKDKNVPVKA